VNDSQAAIKAILNYRARTCSIRNQLRSPGRPLLSLIDMVCKRREKASGDVNMMNDFRWTPAHTDGNSVQSVGNRIADWLAKHALIMKPISITTDKVINLGYIVKAAQRFIDVDLTQGEKVIYLYDNSEKKIIYGDVRKEALIKARAIAVSEWKASASQGLLAEYHNECHLYWKWIVEHQPKCSIFALRLILHYKRIEVPNLCYYCKSRR
jgi:hypothetical protein